MKANIPETGSKRLVIVGGGFAGLTLARKLQGAKGLQVVLIDKNNYHQFQPLFYQVATAGLEPSAISFPFRKMFQKSGNVHVRVAEVNEVDTANNKLHTSIGYVNYDHLVIAIGAGTNFFGNANIMKHAWPMKCVAEALALRNRVLQNYEDAISTEDADERKGLMTTVIVGGGPTGVEVAGTLAELKRFVLPKDYPELNFEEMKIHLLEASPKVLSAMSENASVKAKEYLGRLGVLVQTGVRVTDYDGKTVKLADGSSIRTNTLVWAAGVIGNKMPGLDPGVLTRGNRVKVDRYNRVEGYNNVYALGDIAFMTEEKYPDGHPQLAQPAMQQARLLAKNIKAMLAGKPLKQFHYKDLGSMATVGRNLAVVDLPRFRFQGFIAWLMWMFVHLMSIVGVKNRLLIFINWAWSYFTFDQSLRLIIKPTERKETGS